MELAGKTVVNSRVVSCPPLGRYCNLDVPGGDCSSYTFVDRSKDDRWW